ncbi:hypothetical protein, partial [Bacillus sp. SIMBA_005]|uniref:hypothetical protein n=1 Tax=Bacillus sp. SIMBA_005 TaxID=3085754 RepID=UPI003979066E
LDLLHRTIDRALPSAGILMSLDWNQIATIAWPLVVALVLGIAVHWGLRGLARVAARRADQSLRARIATVVAVPASIAL